MSLLSSAKKYVSSSADVEAVAGFMDALGREESVDELKKILSLDFERVTGLALARLVDLLPSDLELLLTIALWRYHFGLDEDAHEFLDRAKALAPFDLRVAQVEIMMAYGSETEHILNLCRAALCHHPDDEWLLALKHKIEKTGRLEELRSPILNLSWQKLITDGPI